MAGKTVKALPSWIEALLKLWGKDVDEALAEFNELASKYDVPAEWREAVSNWAHDLTVKVTDPGAASALGLSIYLELTSGAPGYNPDHGGLA